MSESLTAPPGNLNFKPGETFLLHVFWEAPSIAAARELLAGLRQCATATHRDTPCVPTYLFRVSTNDADICSPPPRTVNDHPHIRTAFRKLQVGVSLNAVRSDLIRQHLDPSIIDDPNISANTPLPQALQTQPVKVEFTEVYLDERAFFGHASSRDYQNGYASVMQPALQFVAPITMRLGTPPTVIVERILEPMLKENVAPLPAGCFIWQNPQSNKSGSALFVSLDVTGFDKPDEVVKKMSCDFKDHCTTFVAFAHPLRASTIRIMCVLPSLPSQSLLTGLATLNPARGEVHLDVTDEVDSVREALASAGLASFVVNASESVGYVLHARAAEIHPSSNQP